MCSMVEKANWSPLNTISPSNARVIVTKSLKSLEKPTAKPEWLKEWTISKGWIHNRSHLLNLGLDNSDNDKMSDCSSVSIENVDELISLEEPEIDRNVDKIDVISSSTEETDINYMFEQVCENYRLHFPEKAIKQNGNDLKLPEVYKERILSKKQHNHNMFMVLWRKMKPKRRKKSYNCRFTINELYDCQNFTRKKYNSVKKSTLGKNIALYNTLNAKTNLHEEPIYECSDENTSLYSCIYHNPIYMSQNEVSSRKFYDFHSNSRHNRLNLKVRTEKYIIRHIKVRIMLSMRIGHIQKVNVNKLTKKNLNRMDKGLVGAENDMYKQIARFHDEQRRIGNGKTSIKIQNMR